MTTPLLIECGDHKMAPYSFLCGHLITGQSRHWCFVGVDDGREVAGDWICPKCFGLYRAGKLSGDELRPVCMHCVKSIIANLPPTHSTGKLPTEEQP